MSINSDNLTAVQQIEENSKKIWDSLHPMFDKQFNNEKVKASGKTYHWLITGIGKIVNIDNAYEQFMIVVNEEDGDYVKAGQKISGGLLFLMEEKGLIEKVVRH